MPGSKTLAAALATLNALVNTNPMELLLLEEVTDLRAGEWVEVAYVGYARQAIDFAAAAEGAGGDAGKAVSSNVGARITFPATPAAGGEEESVGWAIRDTVTGETPYAGTWTAPRIAAAGDFFFVDPGDIDLVEG